MLNPFQIIADFATLVVDVMDENEQIRSRQIAKERVKREKKKAEKQAREYEIWHKAWIQATKEEFENPDEWRILPYGWSPFGITI